MRVPRFAGPDVRQFLLPRWYSGEPSITLAGSDYRYLARVLRLREGAELAAVDARGARYVMRIASVGRAECRVEIAPAPVRVPPEAPSPAGSTPGAPSLTADPDVSITLLQCLPKGRKIDQIIRQATEAGVSRIIPLFSERSLVRRAEEANRQARLERIAREALQQSGSGRLPLVEAPRPLASLAEEAGSWGTALFFHEEKLAATSLHELLAEPDECVSILVGPEGGLSPAEVDLLTAAGFRPAHLGGTVLRVETAALYAVAAVRTILQERDSWRATQKS